MWKVIYSLMIFCFFVVTFLCYVIVPTINRSDRELFFYQVDLAIPLQFYQDKSRKVNVISFLVFSLWSIFLQNTVYPELLLAFERQWCRSFLETYSFLVIFEEVKLLLAGGGNCKEPWNLKQLTLGRSAWHRGSYTLEPNQKNSSKNFQSYDCRRWNKHSSQILKQLRIRVTQLDLNCQKTNFKWKTERFFKNN